MTIIIWTVWLFLPNKKDQKISYTKDCWTYIYQELSKTLNYIKKNKIIKSGDKIYEHTQTNITWDKYNLNIISNYSWIIKNEKLISSWFCKTANKNKSFYISWNNILISIKTEIEHNEFIFSTCDTNTNSCINSIKINLNKSTQSVSKEICQKFSWWTCEKWQ